MQLCSNQSFSTCGANQCTHKANALSLILHCGEKWWKNRLHQEATCTLSQHERLPASWKTTEEVDNEASRSIEATQRSMLEARGVCTYAAGYSAKLLFLPTCLKIIDTHEGLKANGLVDTPVTHMAGRGTDLGTAPVTSSRLVASSQSDLSSDCCRVFPHADPSIARSNDSGRRVSGSCFKENHGSQKPDDPNPVLAECRELRHQGAMKRSTTVQDAFVLWH